MAIPHFLNRSALTVKTAVRYLWKDSRNCEALIIRSMEEIPISKIKSFASDKKHRRMRGGKNAEFKDNWWLWSNVVRFM